MRKRALIFIIVGSILGLSLAPVVHGATAVGFGVGVPSALPIAWEESFSFITVEALAENNLSFLLTLGTYPNDFPEIYELDTTFLIRAWLGPIALYAGGGFTIQWQLIGEAWLWSPFVNVMAGTQMWIIDSFAIYTQVRSLDPLPATWTFDPEVSLGVTITLGRVRPLIPRVDSDYLWVLIGLGVLAFLAYYPKT